MELHMSESILTFTLRPRGLPVWLVLLSAPVVLLRLCSLMPLLMHLSLLSQPRLLSLRTLLGLLLGHQALVAIQLGSLCFLLPQKSTVLMAVAGNCDPDVTVALETESATLSAAQKSRSQHPKAAT